jgi:hypothetical protein
MQSLVHPLLHAVDLPAQHLQCVQQAGQCVGRGGQRLALLLPPEASTPPEEITDTWPRRRILAQGGLHAILEPSVLLHAHQAGARSRAAVPQFALRNPARGQGPGSLSSIEATRVQVVGLIDHAHHQLSLMRMDQLRDTSSGLDFVHDPLSVPKPFDGDRRAWLTVGEKLPQSPALVRNARVTAETSLGILDECLGLVFMRVKGHV